MALFAIIALLLPDWLVNGWIDRIGVVLGVVLALPVFCYQVTWGQERRARRLFREISNNPGNRPTILVIDLLPGRDTHPRVENFRRQNEALEKLSDDHIVHISRKERLQPDDGPVLQQELREAAQALMQADTDRIHIFVAAPVAAAAMVGAEFANMPALIKGSYVNFGCLRL